MLSWDKEMPRRKRHPLRPRRRSRNRLDAAKARRADAIGSP